MKRYWFVVCVALWAWGLQAQTRNEAYEKYIATYYELAQEQQREHGIPASITLAQGLLESSAGRSELATNANNHFGIKCAGDWKGKGYKYDDDKKDECFRVYKHVRESYEDHSLFLKRPRYQSLFTFDVTDYKNWAYGLKRCGYATDPGYAGKLIQLIETYDLARYAILELDYREQGEDNNIALTPEEQLALQGGQPFEVGEEDTEAVEDAGYKGSKPSMERSMGTLEIMLEHAVLRNNGRRYVVAREGDTFLSLAAEFNMYESTLRRYNDIINPRYQLQAGDKVYLQKKRKKAEKRYTSYRVKRGENIWQIAQDKGMRLKTIYELNGIREGENVTINQRLRLR